MSFDDDAGGIDVPVVPLPDLAERHGIAEIDLLKVDVEGLEDRVILPALSASDLTVRRIYFEDSHSEHWAEDVVGTSRLELARTPVSSRPNRVLDASH